MTLLEPHNLPFAAALVLMLGILVIQAIGLADMFDGDVDVDPGIEGSVESPDGEGALSGSWMDALSSLLGIGRVPFTAWLAIYLLMFAGIGLSAQYLATDLTGSPLYVWLAAAIAGGAALPATGLLARPIGAVLPGDETSAVSTASLVGRRAHITDGVARQASPARARVLDIHGQTHLVMVEPHLPAAELHAGDEVLLVRREGDRFFATATAERSLSPTL